MGTIATVSNRNDTTKKINKNNYKINIALIAQKSGQNSIKRKS